jgi:hypothetical protein
MANDLFKTPEEREIAQRLGFKPPEGPKKVARATTTKVLGYFNPNPWPIHIMISELGGMSVVLQQKGHYVLSSDGKKINDPILEKHVGANGLAREMAVKEVPINFIPRPVMARQSASPVLEATGFVKGPNGQVLPVLKSNVDIVGSPDELPMNGVPVVGMTREMAEKLKLIKPTRTIAESTVVDTDGTPAGGERVPHIEYAEDMTPGEVRRRNATIAPQLPPPPSTAAAVVTPLNPELTTPETAEQAETIAALNSAAKENPLGVTDVGKLVPNLPAETPPPVEEPSGPVPVQGSVPTVEVQGVYGGAPPAPPAAAPAPRFVCAADGAGFQFRSALERHVRGKYPAKFDELMAAYPKPQRPPGAATPA